MTDKVAETKIYPNTIALEEAILVAVKSAAAQLSRQLLKLSLLKQSFTSPHIGNLCANIGFSFCHIFIMAIVLPQIPKLWLEKINKTNKL